MKKTALAIFALSITCVNANEDVQCGTSEKNRISALYEIMPIVRKRMIARPDFYGISEGYHIDPPKDLIVIDNVPSAIAATYLSARPESNNIHSEVKAAHLVSSCSVNSQLYQCVVHIFEDISYCFYPFVPAAVSGDIE